MGETRSIEALCESIEAEVSNGEEENLSKEFFSLIFRIMLMKRKLFSAEFQQRVVDDFMAIAAEAPVKTMIRCMHLVPRGEKSKKCFEQICLRIDEVSSVDFPALLSVVEKQGLSFIASPFVDTIEARIATILSVTKSVHVREELVGMAKRLGLTEPQDVVDAYEEELILANKKSR